MGRIESAKKTQIICVVASVIVYLKINFGKWRYISVIKLMEEANVSVQTNSFLKVTAVSNDEKPVKDGQSYQ